MDLIDLLTELKKINVSISVENNNLKITGTVKNIPEDLLSLVKSNKSEIISFINKNEKKKVNPIIKAGNKEYYQLSPAQKRLYYLQQMSPESNTYNMPLIWHLYGDINLEKIKKSFLLLINRHDAFRTSIKVINGEPVQIIDDNIDDIDIPYEEGKLENIVDLFNEFTIVFDLSKSPLARMKLLKINNDHHILFFDVHHVVTDEESNKVIIQDFLKILKGNNLELQEYQYKDYVEWIKNEDFQSKLSKELEYWKSEFKDDIPEIDLPIDFKRPEIQSFEGSTHEVLLNKSDLDKLKEIADKEDTTMFVLTLAITYIFLSKLCNQNDIVIGTPVFGRPHSEFNKIVGMFVNTLAIRKKINPELTFLNFLSEVKEKANKALDNRNCQIEDIVAQVLKDRKANRNPLFDFMFKYDYLESSMIKNNLLKDANFNIKPYRTKDNKFELTSTKLDLMITLIPYNDGDLGIGFAYCTKLFNRSTILNFINYYKVIINHIINNPVIVINNMPLISKQDNYKETKLNEESTLSLSELFNIQVKENPNQIAIIFNDRKLTYSDLAIEVKSLANHLKNNNISSVVIQSDLTYYNIIAVLASIEAKSIYVPIDFNFPLSVIDEIISKSEVKAVIADKDYLSKISQICTDIELIDITKNLNNNLDEQLKEINSNGIICKVYDDFFNTNSYVEIEEKNMLQAYKIYNNEIVYTKDFLLSSSDLLDKYYFFDKLFPIYTGKSLIITEKSDLRDSNILKNLFTKYSFDNLLINSDYIRYYNNQDSFHSMLKDTQHLTVFGEPLQPSIVENLLDKYNKEVLYVFGHPETSYVTSIRKLNKGDYFNVGELRSDLKYHIFDKRKIQLPDSIYGNCIITGNFINKRYNGNSGIVIDEFNNSENKFLYINDFIKSNSDGSLQLKDNENNSLAIKDIKISINELEEKVKEWTGAKYVVILSQENLEVDAKLLFYIVENEKTSTLKLRKLLRDHLPDFLIPHKIIQTDSLPLTKNNKPDKKKLEQNLSTQTIENQISFDDPLVSKLADIWKQMLNLDKLSITDNFFDIGGHSLLLVQVSDKIEDGLGVKPEFGDFFNQTFGQFVLNYKKKYSNYEFDSEETSEIIAQKC